MSGKVNFSVASQSQINAWKKELADPSTSKDRKHEIVNDWTATRVADAVNRGTKSLESTRKKDLAWNTERAGIVAQSRTTFESMDGIATAMGRLEGANQKDVQAIVGRGSKIFYENAKTAYKDTLYMHEDFNEDTFLKKATEGVAGDILTTGAAAAVGTAAFGGAWYAPAMIAAPSYAAGLFAFSGVVGAGVATGLSLYKAGDFVYMKATLPEMETFPEAQDL